MGSGAGVWKEKKWTLEPMTPVSRRVWIFNVTVISI
jgi:hypothetical protein